MPNTQKYKILNRYLSQAQDSLIDHDYRNYLANLVSLGQWVQKNLQVQHLKDQETVLEAALANLPIPDLKTFNFNQELAFKIFQEAWQDSGLARVKKLVVSSKAEIPLTANS